MTKLVRFVRNWSHYPAGTTANVADALAEVLVKKNIAVVMKTLDEPPCDRMMRPVRIK